MGRKASTVVAQRFAVCQAEHRLAGSLQHSKISVGTKMSGCTSDRHHGLINYNFRPASSANLPPSFVSLQLQLLS